MFSKHLCTLIKTILYDNKSWALSVSVGQIFVPPYKFVPVRLWTEVQDPGSMVSAFTSVYRLIRLGIML